MRDVYLEFRRREMSTSESHIAHYACFGVGTSVGTKRKSGKKYCSFVPSHELEPANDESVMVIQSDPPIGLRCSGKSLSASTLAQTAHLLRDAACIVLAVERAFSEVAGWLPVFMGFTGAALRQEGGAK